MNSPIRAVTVFLLLLVLAPASALASSGDEVATRSYVLANYALMRSAHTKIHLAEANIGQLNKTLGEQCPKVAADSPQNTESQKMSDEVAGALWSIVYHTDVVAVNRFVSAVRPLRWSNHKLTRIAHNYAKSLAQLADLPMPDLCGDVRAWTASGFKTIPAATIAFDRRLDAIGASTIPARLLEPYEPQSLRSLARRASHLELQLEHIETSIGFNDWNQMLETLGLNQ